MSYTTVGIWGKGGYKGETILKYFTFDLFTFSDNIYLRNKNEKWCIIAYSNMT